MDLRKKIHLECNVRLTRKKVKCNHSFPENSWLIHIPASFYLTSIWNLFVVGKFRSRKEKTSTCVTLNNGWVLRINIHFNSLYVFPDTDRSSIKTNWSISQISDFVNFLPLTFQLAPVQCWQHINQLSSSSIPTLSYNHHLLLCIS